LISIAIAGAMLNLIRQQCVGSQRSSCGEEEEDGEAVTPVRQKRAHHYSTTPGS